MGNPLPDGDMYLANASPTIINCTITNCSIRGGHGAAGKAGNQEGENGGNGGWGGVAYGAGMFCSANSNPRLENCRITNNTA